MAFEARVLLDSVSPAGKRLTTFEVKFPRIILAEFNTHRVFSRNFSSSRAIPVKKMIQAVLDDPFVPVYWGKNDKGMSAYEELQAIAASEAVDAWLAARDSAVEYANFLITDLNVHKQTANRILEPWTWATGIVSATEWDNFYKLRTAENAQPEFRKLAGRMKAAHDASTPVKRGLHVPMLDEAEYLGLKEALQDRDVDKVDWFIKVATGRLARVSYLTHDGVRDQGKDVDLHNSLLENKHMSPFEHIAYATETTRGGNFKGWQQYRGFVEAGV